MGWLGRSGMQRTSVSWGRVLGSFLAQWEGLGVLEVGPGSEEPLLRGWSLERTSFSFSPTTFGFKTSVDSYFLFFAALKGTSLSQGSGCALTQSGISHINNDPKGESVLHSEIVYWETRISRRALSLIKAKSGLKATWGRGTFQ